MNAPATTTAAPPSGSIADARRRLHQCAAFVDEALTEVDSPTIAALYSTLVSDVEADTATEDQVAALVFSLVATVNTYIDFEVDRLAEVFPELDTLDLLNVLLRLHEGTPA